MRPQRLLQIMAFENIIEIVGVGRFFSLNAASTTSVLLLLIILDITIVRLNLFIIVVVRNNILFLFIIVAITEINADIYEVLLFNFIINNLIVIVVLNLTIILIGKLFFTKRLSVPFLIAVIGHLAVLGL